MIDDDTQREHEFWQKAASSHAAARVAIYGDPSAWDGQALTQCLDAILPVIRPRCVPGSRVLDFGCGIGRLTIPIAQALPDCKLIGVDISSSMLGLAEATAPDIDWVLSDGRRLPDVEPLAAAFSMITLQHIPREAAAAYIHQIGAALVPGGVFRFQVYEGATEGFLCHQVDVGWVRKVCNEADLEVKALESVECPVPGEGRWLWATAEK